MFNVTLDSILIQVMIIQCFKTLSITLNVTDMYILFCTAISINLIKLSKLEKKDFYYFAEILHFLQIKHIINEQKWLCFMYLATLMKISY